MHFYILTSFFILVSFFVETSQSDCLLIDSGVTDEEICYNATDNSSSYSCVLNVEENKCVEIEGSECNNYTDFTDKITEEVCQKLETFDEKYKCVPKNEHRCIEEAKSECLKTSYNIFKKRRLSTEYFIDEDCKYLDTRVGKKCVVNEDGTGCDEVDFSYGLNLNKLSLFISCILFFL